MVISMHMIFNSNVIMYMLWPGVTANNCFTELVFDLVPVKESPTIYDAFIAEEERQEKKLLEMERELYGKAGNKKQIGGPSGKKTGPDRKREPPTLENSVPEVRGQTDISH